MRLARNTSTLLQRQTIHLLLRPQPHLPTQIPLAFIPATSAIHTSIHRLSPPSRPLSCRPHRPYRPFRPFRPFPSPHRFASTPSTSSTSSTATTATTATITPRRNASSHSSHSSHSFQYPDVNSRPFRSMLYAPASNVRALEKLSKLFQLFDPSQQSQQAQQSQQSQQTGQTGLPARPDAIILDLEDGVAPRSKDSGRENAVQFLQSVAREDVDGSDRENNGSHPFVIVRINGWNTPWFEPDARAVTTLKARHDAAHQVLQGVLLPKVNSWEDVNRTSKYFQRLLESEESIKSNADGDCTADRNKTSNTNEMIETNGTNNGNDDTDANHATDTTDANNANDANNTNDANLSILSPIPLWAMIETPTGVLHAQDIASHPSIQGLVLGTNDLSKDIGLRPTVGSEHSRSSNNSEQYLRPLRQGLTTALQTTILAARAHHKLVIDGVYNSFKDANGHERYREECLQGKEWGMDGKSLIHPNQIPMANEVFGPSVEEVEYARRVLACWEEATGGRAGAAGGEGREGTGGMAGTGVAAAMEATGDTSSTVGQAGQFTGVAVLDGALIEELHVENARRLLERAEMIERS